MVTLAGAPEDQPPGRQRETGSAKKKSHNASHSKRPVVEGARRKAAKGKRPTSNSTRLRDQPLPSCKTVECSERALDQGGALSKPPALPRRFVNRRSLSKKCVALQGLP